MNEEVRAALADVLEVEPSMLTSDVLLADLENWDSVTALTIMIVLGDELGVPVLPHEMKNLETFGDLEALVASKCGAGGE